MQIKWYWVLPMLLLAAALVLTGCGKAAAPESGWKTIDAEEAKRMMDEGGVTVVDVRQPDEYAAGHVPGALLLPDDQISSEAAAVLPDQEAAVLVYCRSGRRSRGAAAKLAELGYQNVYDFGGINDWPYDVVEGEAP